MSGAQYKVILSHQISIKGEVLKKVLILGSNSFGATALIGDLLDSKWEVIGVSRSQIKEPLFLTYLANNKLTSFTFHQIDIVKQIEALYVLISESKPEFIVDFAGQGMVAESWFDPSSWYQTNILSKVGLLEFLNREKLIEKYIRISTPEVYGNTVTEVYETAAFNPSTPYALSHATIDKHLELLNTRYGFPSVVGRFANFYGPGQQLYRIVPKTFMKFLSGSKIQLHGSGTSKRAFIHGADVSSAIKSLMTLGRNGQTYHFSTRDFFSISNLVGIIGAQLGLDWMKLTESVIDRPGKDNQYLMNFSKSAYELGWNPQVSFDQGLKEVESWILKNFDALTKYSLEYKHVE